MTSWPPRWSSSTATWRLDAVPAAPFSLPTDPVLVMQGDRIEPVRRNGVARTIAVRTDRDVVGTLKLAAGQRAFSVDAAGSAGPAGAARRDAGRRHLRRAAARGGAARSPVRARDRRGHRRGGRLRARRPDRGLPGRPQPARRARGGRPVRRGARRRIRPRGEPRRQGREPLDHLHQRRGRRVRARRGRVERPDGAARVLREARGPVPARVADLARAPGPARARRTRAATRPSCWRTTSRSTPTRST